MGLLRVRNPGLRNQVGDGEERVKAFGDGPRQAFLFSLILDIAGGHVDGEKVSYKHSDSVATKGV